MFLNTANSRERERENQGIRSKCTENSWIFKNPKTQKLLITFFQVLFGNAIKPFSNIGTANSEKMQKRREILV
jgi:hypothetical protein